VLINNLTNQISTKLLANGTAFKANTLSQQKKLVGFLAMMYKFLQNTHLPLIQLNGSRGEFPQAR